MLQTSIEAVAISSESHNRWRDEGSAGSVVTGRELGDEETALQECQARETDGNRAHQPMRSVCASCLQAV
jgi:hypothetical protein